MTTYTIPLFGGGWKIVRTNRHGLEVARNGVAMTVQPHHIAPEESAGRKAAAVPPPVPAPPAHARNTDPAPAHEAAARVNVHGDAWLVLRAHVEAGERGLTGDDLEAATGRRYSNIGPRRPWLEAQGWVAPTGDKRGGKGVYVATAEGVAAWERHSAEVAA